MPTLAPRLPIALAVLVGVVLPSASAAAALGITLAVTQAPVAVSAGAAGAALVGLLAFYSRGWRQTPTVAERDESARADS